MVIAESEARWLQRSESDSDERLQLWVVVTGVLMVLGVLAAVFAAKVAGQADANESVKSFQSSAAAISSDLQLGIQHESDVVTDGAAVLSTTGVTQSAFRDWAKRARVLTRYPEIQALGLLNLVKAADLPAFAAQAVADPVGVLPADGKFTVSPPGARPFYCLRSVGIGRNAAATSPAGTDPCVITAVAHEVTTIRDSGQATYLPFQLGGRNWLTIETPIYRRAGVPPTVAARRAAFVGVFVVQLDPGALLTQAVRDRPDLSVAMRYHVGATDISFASGPAAPGATSVTTDLHNGWTVRTFGVLPRGGLSDQTELTALIAGIAISVLLGLLVFSLGTSRERARRLVRLRTEQLHYQALHDALTGLPNRTLLLDRIAQMLVRNRRRNTTGAVMFLDLDDFKNVNDTLGHNAGDRLLVEVAARLTSVVRSADTIGRMGGDEFIVLLDSTSPEATPELVAERLLEVMRQPFELSADTPPLKVNVSIGIAAGDRDSAIDMLHDADLALYQAKASGKNRYEVFAARTLTTS